MVTPSINLPFVARQLPADNLVEQRLQEQRLIDDRGEMGSYTLLAHADLYYNLKGTDPRAKLLPNSVKWQLLHAAQAEKMNGAIVLGVNFGFAHLASADFALLYKIIFSYCSAPQAVDSPIKTRLIQLDTFLSNLVSGNPFQAEELLNQLKISDDARLIPIVNKLEAQAKVVHIQPRRVINDGVSGVGRHENQLQQNELQLKSYVPKFSAADIKALMQKEPEVIVTSGGSGKVLLYADIALKIYDEGYTEVEKKALRSFFKKEIATYELIGDSNPKCRVLGYDEENMIIAMTRLKGTNALDMVIKSGNIDGKTKNAKKAMSQLMEWLATFHEITLKPVPMENACYKDLEIINTEIDSISSFKAHIAQIKDEPSRANILDCFNLFLQKKAPPTLFLAHCNNDVSFSDFFPAENALIDFNAAGISPIAKDVAATLVNLYFHPNTVKAFQMQHSAAIRSIFKEAVTSYLSAIQARHADFKLDVSLVRFFMAHQLLKASLPGTDIHMLKPLYKKITTLLTLVDEDLDSAIECLISQEKIGYWGYLLGEAMTHANKVGSYSLLAHANNFNFMYGQQCSPLPEEVKWQILFASQPQVAADGTLQLHKDFGLEHLTSAEFATLYQIVTSYVNECSINYPLDKRAGLLGKALLSYFEGHAAAPKAM